MLKARAAKEVALRLPNEIGSLNRIVKVLADKGINILAVSVWVEGHEAVVRLLTDDTSRVVDALNAEHHRVHEADVVVTQVAHKPGMLRRITDMLAQDGIDIHHLYATSAASQNDCLVVFATANNDRAIVRLNVDVH